MSNAEREQFVDAYRVAFEAYLAEPAEFALVRAYELGRSALAGRLGVLDIATVHSRVLATVLEHPPPDRDRVREFTRRVRLLADELYEAGEDLVGGIGYYPWGVHVDTRPGNRLVVFHGGRLYSDLPGERPR